jgi:hypothetical protein
MSIDRLFSIIFSDSFISDSSNKDCLRDAAQTDYCTSQAVPNPLISPDVNQIIAVIRKA